VVPFPKPPALQEVANQSHLRFRQRQMRIHALEGVVSLVNQLIRLRREMVDTFSV
jgi:hypothetical protein